MSEPGSNDQKNASSQKSSSLKRGQERISADDREGEWKETKNDDFEKSESNVFKRCFEHVDGNWAGFISVSICLPHVTNNLQRLQALALRKYTEDRNAESFMEIICVENLHISLSRTFTLRSHQIQPLVDKLGKEIAEKIATTKRSSIEYIVDISNKAYTLQNEVGTREFVCLPVESDYAGILPLLVQACDAVLAAFQKPSFHSDPQFHVSIASFVPSSGSAGEIMPKKRKTHSAGELGCPPCSPDKSDGCDLLCCEEEENEEDLVHIGISAVECRFGNRKFTLDLNRLDSGFVEKA